MGFATSDLPFGSEFSPSQIDLPSLLELARVNEGDPRALEAAILRKFFARHAKGQGDPGSVYNRAKLANNCKLGMIAYGLIDREAGLTKLGSELYDARNNPNQLYALLGRQILLNLHGMALVQCIQDMTVAGETVNLTSLRAALAERGINYPAGGKHPSMMRLWLAKTGIFMGSRWQVDERRLQEVLGVSSTDFQGLAKLSVEQRAFIRALANIGTDAPQSANEVARLAAATFGVRFPEKSLPKLVLNDLVKSGYITAKKTTSGRGAKPFLVAPTKKLVGEVIGPLLDQLKEQTDPKLLALLRKSLAEITVELKSRDRYVAGLALEALAFKLMRLLDMEYVGTRLRAEATGGAEVDLVFQSARLVFSRWQVQCKNTARVSLDDVAKEVGLTHFLKSTVIVVVTTGSIGGEARKYSNKIMRDSNLAIVLVDSADLASIGSNGAAIIDVFSREARNAMKLKALEALES